MRKLFLLALLVVSVNSFGQFPSRGLIQLPTTNGIGFRGTGGDSLLWIPSDTIQPASSLTGRTHIARKGTTLYYWNGTKYTAITSGGGNTNSNVGSAYRLAIPNTNNIKTLGANYGIILDSATSNQIGIKADTATLFPAVRATISGGGGSQTLQQTVNLGNTSDTDIVINNGGKLISDSVKLVPISNQFTLFDTVYAGGNSITVGLNSTVADSAYINRVAAFHGKTLDNKAVSGTGAYQAILNHNLYVNPNHHKESVIMAGFNDVRYGGNNPLTYRKIINALKSIFVNQYLKNYTPAGGSGVTRVGGWTTSYPANTVGGKSNNGAYTPNTNDYITYTFTDSTVVWSSIGTDSSYGAANYSEAVDVLIDNVLIETISLDNQTDGVTVGGNDNKRSAISFIYRGLSYGSHTLKLINKTAHGYYLVVDYVGNLIPSASAMPLVFMHAPKMDATGYATSPANATSVIIDSLNSKIDSLKAALPSAYPVYVARTNDYYVATTSSGLSSDHIHPNDTGHRQIYNAYLSATPLSSTTVGKLYYLNNSGFYGIVEGAPKKFLMSGDPIPGTSNNLQTTTDYGATTTNAITVTGQAKIGGNDPTAAPNVFSVNSGNPYRSFYKSGAGSNSKIWDVTVDNTTQYHRILNDAYNSATNFMTIVRSGTTVSSITFPSSAPITTGGYIGSNGVTQIGGDASLNTSYGTSLGLNTGQPYLSFYKSGAGTNEKFWDWYVDNTTYHARLINDANSSATDWLNVVRSGTTVSSISFPNGKVTVAVRIEQAKGIDVTAANDLTLGSDGNLFHIAGATTINAITTVNWQAGSEITLIFDSTPTIKNNTAGGGGTAKLLLAGGADFSATANDVLKLVFDGTSWFEVSRSVN